MKNHPKIPTSFFVNAGCSWRYLPGKKILMDFLIMRPPSIRRNITNFKGHANCLETGIVKELFI